VMISASVVDIVWKEPVPRAALKVRTVLARLPVIRGVVKKRGIALAMNNASWAECVTMICSARMHAVQNYPV